MASVVERGLADEEFRLELRRVGEATAARHTWERVADRTITACAPTRRRRHTAARPQTARRARRFVLARRRARASWSARLVHMLGKEVEVDCFDASGAGNGDEVRRRQPIGVLGETVDPWSYDAFVYLVDEATPPAVLDAARRYPGVVWFLVPPAECPDAHALASAARVRLVPPETVAPNGPAQVAPFARPTPTQTASADDLEGAAATGARARASVAMTPSAPLHACTTATRAQLPAARVLCESLRRHHPDAEITLLVVDDVERGRARAAGRPARITLGDRRAGRRPLPACDRVHRDRARRRARASPRAGADRGRCPRRGGVRSRHRGLRPTARPRRPRRRTRDRPDLPARRAAPRRRPPAHARRLRGRAVHRIRVRRRRPERRAVPRLVVRAGGARRAPGRRRRAVGPLDRAGPGVVPVPPAA